MRAEAVDQKLRVVDVDPSSDDRWDDVRELQRIALGLDPAGARATG